MTRRRHASPNQFVFSFITERVSGFATALDHLLHAGATAELIVAKAKALFSEFAGEVAGRISTLLPKLYGQASPSDGAEPDGRNRGRPKRTYRVDGPASNTERSRRFRARKTASAACYECFVPATDEPDATDETGSFVASSVASIRPNVPPTPPLNTSDDVDDGDRAHESDQKPNIRGNEWCNERPVSSVASVSFLAPTVTEFPPPDINMLGELATRFGECAKQSVIEAGKFSGWNHTTAVAESIELFRHAGSLGLHPKEAFDILHDEYRLRVAKAGPKISVFHFCREQLIAALSTAAGRKKTFQAASAAAAAKQSRLFGAVDGGKPPARPAAPIDPRWLPIFTRLTAMLGEAVAESWFVRVRLGDIVDGCAIVLVPSKFLRNWISSHYGAQITDAIAAEHPGTVRVTFVVADRDEGVA